MTRAEPPWWKRAVFYHIYPRSYQDTTGNGVGDLDGIRRRLDYLQWLGIDAIWLSPCFPSPMADFGYDVSDYTDIDPLFGTLADMDALLEAAHRRGIKVVLDFVPNHTSDQHPWFLESRSSRDNPKRDWYLWRDPGQEGDLPNNWYSLFGGTAWQWDPLTQQYYLHTFLKEQPDLNWRNPEVRQAMHDVLRFWLDRGVDGFRVDAVRPLIKDDQFRDNPPRQPGPIERVHGEADLQEQRYTSDRPELHQVLRELRQLVDRYPGERVLVGEIYTLEPEVAATYYGDGDQLHLVHIFTLVNLPWKAELMRRYVEAFEAELRSGDQPTVNLGSHDEPRLASRYGVDHARVAAVMLLTLRGTPFIYYGDEIGMLNGDLPEGQSLDPLSARTGLPELSRDRARTPMQWDASPQAGFTTAEQPWLPVHPGYPEVNVERQRGQPESLLNLYRQLIQFRKQSPALTDGDFASYDAAPAGTFCFERRSPGQRLLVALNFTSRQQQVALPTGSAAHCMISSEPDRHGAVEGDSVLLRGNEAVVLELT